MPRTFTPNGQNLRLIVIAAFALVAIVTTLASASESPDESADGDDLAPSALAAVEAPAEVTTSTVAPDPDPDAVEADVAEPETGGIEADLIQTDGIGQLIVADTNDGVVAPDVSAEPEVAELEELEPVIEGVEGCPPIEAAPAADDDAFFSETFDANAEAWDALSGSWSVQDGSYQQTDSSGYDLISQLRVDPPEQFRVSVTLQPLGDGLGGGLVLAQPLPAERSGATVIDFTDGGSFLRWGRYDPSTGQYAYVGGVSLGDSFDPSVAHELTVEVRNERTMVLVDSVDVGTFEALGFGRIGLVTSRSAVAFDNLRIVEVG